MYLHVYNCVMESVCLRLFIGINLIFGSCLNSVDYHIISFHNVMMWGAHGKKVSNSKFIKG